MEREGHENDRAFYCEAWNGTGSLSATTGSGAARSTSRPRALASSAASNRSRWRRTSARPSRRGQDDGLIQRFQLLVYPDVAPTWRNIDRRPDHDARQALVSLFQRLDALDAVALGAISRHDRAPICTSTPRPRRPSTRGAPPGNAPPDGGLIIPLGSTSREVPAPWCRASPSCPGGRYLEPGVGGPISADAVARACAWSAYLEPHAAACSRAS